MDRQTNPLKGVTQSERTAALAKLTETRQQLDKLEKELTQYGACDPVKVEEKRRAVVLAKEAAVRWTGEGLQLAILIPPQQHDLRTKSTPSSL